MHIRPGMPADFTALQSIEVRAGELFTAIGMPEIAAHPPGELDEYAAAEALLVAVGDDEQLLGYAWIELVDDTTYLEQLSVLPEAGRRGIGTALLEAVADWARARSDDAIVLTTFREVPFNGPLYAKRGFVHVREANWTEAQREIIAFQATLGMDPASRTVMRRSLT